MQSKSESTSTATATTSTNMKDGTSVDGRGLHSTDLNVYIIPPSKWSKKELFFMSMIALMTVCWMALSLITGMDVPWKVAQFWAIMVIVVIILTVLLAPDAATWMFYQFYLMTGIPVFTKRAKFVFH